MDIRPPTYFVKAFLTDVGLRPLCFRDLPCCEKHGPADYECSLVYKWNAFDSVYFKTVSSSVTIVGCWCCATGTKMTPDAVSCRSAEWRTPLSAAVSAGGRKVTAVETFKK